MTRGVQEKAAAFFKSLSAGKDARTAAMDAGLDASEARALLESAVSSLSNTTGAPLKLVIYVDGASRGNPGKAGAGAVLKNAETGEAVKRLLKKLGTATNNVAEYSALIMALSEAKKLGAVKVTVFADSELMVKQINGEYRVKNEGLLPLYAEASILKKSFAEFSIAHVEREKNREADKLANDAIDKNP